MNVTDLSPAVQALASQRPRISDCGCLADAECQECRPVRRKILGAAGLGHTADRIALDLGLEREAVVAELALERRRARDRRAAAPARRRAMAQREVWVAAFGLTRLAAAKVTSGESFPNRPFGDEFRKRDRAYVYAAMRTGGYDPNEKYIGAVSRHVGMDTSGISRSLGVMAESRSAKKTARADGTTHEGQYGGHKRPVIRRETAERIAEFWCLDPIELIENHPLVKQERKRRAAATKQSRHTKGTKQ